MKLEDIMNRFPQTVFADDTLIRARDLMVWGGFRHLPVVAPDGRTLIGLVTERDIAEHQARTGESLASSPTDAVAMAMVRRPHTAGPGDSVTEAAARMAADKIGCLPVTEEGKLVGLVTTTDVLTAEVRASMEASSSRDGALVEDVMTDDVQVAHSDDSLLDAAARMRRYRVRHLPIVDADRHVVGMLSDRDVRTAIGDPVRAFQQPANLRVGLMRVEDAMTSSPRTASTDDSCQALASVFANIDAGALPVVDGENRLVGIVSYVDVLRAFAD